MTNFLIKNQCRKKVNVSMRFYKMYGNIKQFMFLLSIIYTIDIFLNYIYYLKYHKLNFSDTVIKKQWIKYMTNMVS